MDEGFALTFSQVASAGTKWRQTKPPPLLGSMERLCDPVDTGDHRGDQIGVGKGEQVGVGVAG
jgi:hypothetical protein